jgi:hypothetical protein
MLQSHSWPPQQWQSVSLRHQLGAAHLAASMSGASAAVPCECVMYFTHASSIFWTAAGHDCAGVVSSTSAARRKSNDATVNSRDTSSDEGALQNTYGASREDAAANTAYPGWRPFRHESRQIIELNRSCRERLKSEFHEPAALCVVFFGQSLVVFDHL